jgi:cell division protein FtsB
MRANYYDGYYQAPEPQITVDQALALAVKLAKENEQLKFEIEDLHSDFRFLEEEKLELLDALDSIDH